jgi:branched-chain amino acid transport system permease protein
MLNGALRAMVSRDTVVFALAAIGLNLHFGFTGLLNFGQSGFMAMGAYGIAVAVATFGLSLWVGVGLGVVGAVVLALVLGVPTLRLRADYLAITTIAASEIIRLVFRSATLRGTLGGSDGMQNFADDFFAINPLAPGRYGFGPFVYNDRDAWVLIVGWGLILVISLMMFLLVRSPWGRVLKSIREDEDAARSLGKNVYAYKMQSLILGGVIGAVAGMISAVGAQSVQPDNFSPQVTFFAYTILILGGAGRVGAPVVGSMIFWFLISALDNFLRQLAGTGIIPPGFLSNEQVGITRFALVGLALMLLMIYRPQGIFGDRKELMLDAR